MPEIPDRGSIATEKVGGRFRYLTDYPFRGFLWAALIRSPHPRADYLGLDRPALLTEPGVRGVFDAYDVPQIKYNPATVPPGPYSALSNDKPILARQARFSGDAVAVVLADTARAARIAADKAKVRWDPLPAITNFDDADRQGLSLCQVSYSDDGVDDAFEQAQLVVRHSVRIERAQHICLEPHTCAALPTRNGGLVLWTQSQAPRETQRIVADALGLPVNLLHTKKVSEGGGFGARQEIYEEVLISWVALRLNRGIRIMYTREEEFVSTRVRHGGNLHVRLALSNAGGLLASDLHVALDAGAYASHTPYVLNGAGGHLPTVYPQAAHRFHARAVPTNSVPSGAYRGYGVAEAAAVVEQAIELAASKLEMSPLALRAANVPSKLGACLARLPAGKTHDAATGIGYGVAIKHSVGDPGRDRSEARVSVLRSDNVRLATGTSDCGTGSSAALAQILASELGASLSAITVVEGDSATAPMDLGSTAQRSVYCGGQAVSAAAKQLRSLLLSAAHIATGVSPDRLEVRWPRVLDRIKATEVATIDRLLEREPAHRFAAAAKISPKGLGVSYCALAVQVTVDKATGCVHIVGADAVVDCGRVINATSARGQVIGAISQGLGLAYLESAQISESTGRPVTTIQEHGVPRSTDVPAIGVEFLGHSESDRPPRGLGEIPIVAVQAAVANAIAAACGRPMTRLPLKPAEVYAEATRSGTSRR